ncbi:DUF58 domain-containing protein [Fontisphaera persica]|uniref:DUF58 domain-containing protein n=1 Tax=Fontisphaera persica TaxID=2974023 RepID=UPI0024BFB076|nr:DUF58 domain-containing protein [Fontisphaera persica]WCJ58630.1 DUF58 domain-containing protein [Fontisphaera persica]
MYRLTYLIYGLVTGLRGWSERRFTAAGLAVLGGLLMALLTGFQTESYRALSQQTLGLLVALLVLAWVGAWRFRAPVQAERHLPRHATAGTPVRYTLVLRNLRPRPEAGLRVRERLADQRPDYAEFAAAMQARDRRGKWYGLGREPLPEWKPLATVRETQVPVIRPNGEVDVTVELTPQRRGILRFEGVWVARTDPLGLFRALDFHPLPGTLCVLPRRYPLPPLALPGARRYQPGGVALAGSVGLADEFVGLREYRPGDPLRRVHWKSWAKVGQPVVKEYEDEFFVRHALILDTFCDDPKSAAFEEAVSVAASFACTLLTQESLLDLLFVGTQAYCFTAGRGLAHTEQMLEILAAVKTCQDQPFEALSHLVMRHLAAVSGCVGVFVAWDEPRRELARRLEQLGVPLLSLVVVTPEEAAPLRRYLQEHPAPACHLVETDRVAESLARL